MSFANEPIKLNEAIVEHSYASAAAIELPELGADDDYGYEELPQPPFIPNSPPVFETLGCYSLTQLQKGPCCRKVKTDTGTGKTRKQSRRINGVSDTGPYRSPYKKFTIEESQKLFEFIKEHSFERYVKGSKLYKRMEEASFLTGRSAASMQNHVKHALLDRSKLERIVSASYADKLYHELKKVIPHVTTVSDQELDRAFARHYAASINKS